MHIDLRTVAITPLRHTFDHIARRIGADKAASRYQEGTLDIQPSANLQYRPTWDPAHQLYDPARTALVMQDWYAFKDPRQFYYGTYTLARARMQEAAEAGFDFVETRGLAELMPDEVRRRALDVLVPLRHVAYGANLNNVGMCAYGYGTAVTQPCIYHGMDHLGIAQYLTRIGLWLAGTAELEDGRSHWLGDGRWQPLRRQVENSLVVKDWFELFVAQNLVQDGLLYPLVYAHFVDRRLNAEGGSAVSMVCAFMNEWFAESSRWVDATIKTAAAESPANAALIAGWLAHWRGRVREALLPVAELAFDQDGEKVLDTVTEAFDARVAKLGIAVKESGHV